MNNDWTSNIHIGPLCVLNRKILVALLPTRQSFEFCIIITATSLLNYYFMVDYIGPSIIYRFYFIAY